MSLSDYGSYMREVNVDWDEIWWVTNSLNELVSDGILSKEEAQNLVDSLYYGERYKEFNEEGWLVMLEFEKWKNKNCEAKNCPHEASCNGCENMWRAALEWSQGINKKITEKFQDSLYGAIKQSIAIDMELRGE